MEWDRFVSLFGGPVFSATPLQPHFLEHLVTLGGNKLPTGLDGRADDLFEAYVQVALEFVLWGKVIRYGQERRFEARPDGVALLPRFRALYDAKAYADGYEVTADTIRQFESYVNEFMRMYRQVVERLNAFIVISGSFPHREETLARRSRELLARCGVPLVFLTSEALGRIVGLLRDWPAARGSINWAEVFVDPVVRPESVKDAVEAISRDRVLPPR